MSTDTITIYGMIGSQPVKTVTEYCKMHQIPFKSVCVIPPSGETKTPEYMSLFSTSTIPGIVHGDFKLTESFAICTYLAEYFKINDHWYPSEPKERAKIHEYFFWHHDHIRNGAYYLVYTFFQPIVLKIERNERKIKELKEIVDKALDYVETQIRKHGTVAGTLQLSLADLACYNEVKTLREVSQDFPGYPNITKWSDDFEAMPEVKETNNEADEFFQQWISGSN